MLRIITFILSLNLIGIKKTKCLVVLHGFTDFGNFFIVKHTGVP